MATIELRDIEFTITCDCGRKFVAEEFDPECPYCGRKYRVRMRADDEKIKLTITSS
jgi:Zn finger protein HypA/HybF involved in hydrogenase expression